MTIELLTAARIVPVVVIDEAAQAMDVATALLDGGITCAEITLRTPAGVAALAAISALDGFTVGAGTVLTPAQVDECVDAGARFIVSPGLDEQVVARALELGVAVIPGVATATEIQRALRVGVDHVKFFPANHLGGLPAIDALSAPFPGVRFMPSGGVGEANALDYLGHPAVFAIGGSWMVGRSAIAAGDFEGIRAASAAATALIGGAR